MSWKGTIHITKTEAIGIIVQEITNCSVIRLEEILDQMGFGNDSGLPYYGAEVKVEDE